MTLDPADVRKRLTHASYHVRLAVAIGALAPKLRLANILSLEWAKHFDKDFRFITVAQHKTRHHTGKPLVVAIPEQLRRILQDARKRNRGKYVVAYRGERVAEIRGGVHGAAKRAGLTYGRLVEHGLTFHTLRHSAATLLADLDVPEAKRKAMLGHTRLETTQRYTHLRPVAEVPTAEQLSAALPIEDLVTQPWRRASNKKSLGNSLGTRSEGPSDSSMNPGTDATDASKPDLRIVPGKRA